MKKRSMFACAVAVLTCLLFTAADARAGLSQTVTGTLPGGGAFNGTFNITKFVNQNGQVAAVGTLTGKLTNAAGSVIGTVTNAAATLLLNRSATAAGSTCDILHLVLGPLDLNLLGGKCQYVPNT
jgi:hypothetical protein